MTPTEAIKTSFGKFAVFRGRAQRTEFWWFFLFCLLTIPLLGFTTVGIYPLALFLPYLGVSARRLHDTGRSAWWLFSLMPIFIVAAAVFLVAGAEWSLADMLMLGADVIYSEQIGLVVLTLSSAAIAVGCQVTLLVLCARPGTVGPNRYGPDPLHPEQGAGETAMTPTEAIKTSFKKFAVFRGRAQRTEFWWFFLFCLLTIPILGAVLIYPLALFLPYLAVSARRLHDTGRSAWWLFPLMLIFILASAVSLVGVVAFSFAGMFGAEVNYSENIGLVVLTLASAAIAVGCQIILLVLCGRPGTVGPNRYGPDPLRPEQEAGD